MPCCDEMTLPIVTIVQRTSVSCVIINTITEDAPIFVSMSHGARGTPWWSQLQLAAVRTKLSVGVGATVSNA
jgi:hypothetical protein